MIIKKAAPLARMISRLEHAQDLVSIPQKKLVGLDSRSPSGGEIIDTMTDSYRAFETSINIFLKVL